MGEVADQGEVVRDQHHGEAELVAEPDEEFDDLRLDGDVEGGGRLVRDQEAGAAGQGHGDEDALALAAGELVRVAAQGALGREADQFEEFGRGLRTAARGELPQLGADENGGVEGGERVLVDHRDLGAHQGAAFPGRELQQVPAAVEDLAADLGVAGEKPHDGEAGDGLAAAGLADQAEGFALVDGEVQLVDDGDVAVAVGEADRQVAHDEEFVGVRADRGDGGLGGVDVLRELGEGGVDVDGGGGLDRVGCGGGRGVDGRAGALGRGGGVGEAFGEDVEREDRDQEGQAGEERGPPAAGQEDLPAVGEDAAPAGVGVLHTGADEGEAGLEDDGFGDHDRREDHDRGHAVDRDVLEHDVAAPGPDDLLGGDVVLAVLGQDVGADHAGQRRGVDEGDREDDHRDAGAEHRDEDGRERDRRERHDDVEGAHDGLVAEPARGGGERAEQGSGGQGAGGRAEADDQRVARAVQDAGEHVAARPVGAEPVVAARGLDGGARGQGVLGEQGGEYGAEDDDDQDAEGDAGGYREGAEGDARSGELLGQTARGEHVTPS